jgi:hypothetical protein
VVEGVDPVRAASAPPTDDLLRLAMSINGRDEEVGERRKRELEAWKLLALADVVDLAGGKISMFKFFLNATTTGRSLVDKLIIRGSGCFR